MSEQASNRFAIVMAGGAGTRFWPASKKSRPKQLLPLGRSATQSLLAETVERILPLVPKQNIFIATNTLLTDAIAQELPWLRPSQILAEPTPRNTAPCIGWATSVIARTHPKAEIMVLPSDHAIGNEEAFRTAILTALSSAEEKRCVATIGIVPTRAETGYGYIEMGSTLEKALGASSALKVVRFVEKPSREKAEEYLQARTYLWNAGMFFYNAEVMLSAIGKHMPDLLKDLIELDAAAASGNGDEALKTLFPRMPSISIDYGVMEREKELLVVPGEFGWNDLGSWQSAWELADKNTHGNVCAADDIVVDGTNNYVRDLTIGAKRKQIALVGVSNLVVVETDEAILIIDRERSQDVKLVVDELKRRGLDALL